MNPEYHKKLDDPRGYIILNHRTMKGKDNEGLAFTFTEGGAQMLSSGGGSENYPNDSIKLMRTELRGARKKTHKVDQHSMPSWLRKDRPVSMPSWLRKDRPVSIHLLERFYDSKDTCTDAHVTLCFRPMEKTGEDGEKTRSYEEGFFFGAAFCSPFKDKKGKVDNFDKSVGFKLADSRCVDSTMIPLDLKELYRRKQLLKMVHALVSTQKYTPQWAYDRITTKAQNRAAYRALPLYLYDPYEDDDCE